MIYNFADYRKAADYLSSRLGDFRPEILIVLGSGLSSILESISENAVSVSFDEIPGFRTPTAPGHKGTLYFGTLEGRNLAVMSGRLHYYEGYSLEEVCFPIRVLRLLGVDKAILTNAAGGINLSFRVGDICLITDHIKLFPDSPLRGANLPEFGTRFPDCTQLYSPRLQNLAREAARAEGQPLQEGVYMIFGGPNYETPAEIRAARALGADLAGMSTVPEALCAGHAGMEVLAFSMVSNAAAGITGEKLTEEEVLESGKIAGKKLAKVLLRCIREM